LNDDVKAERDQNEGNDQVAVVRDDMSESLMASDDID